jgi:hypothetical protein
MVLIPCTVKIEHNKRLPQEKKSKIMQKSNTEQTVFIITGMHRSGTSLTASILQSAGIHIGRNLLGADQVNIKGHWENIDFYEFHMNILDSQGLSSAGWTLQDNLEIKEEFIDRAKQIIEKNALSSVWGWKEPRTTLFLDFWAKRTFSKSTRISH